MVLVQNIRRFAATAVLSLSFLFVPASANAAEITVCSADCDHTTISSAIAAASAGDTIKVSAGTYAESVVIDKSLTLLGPNANISPNSANPLEPNTSRVTEAVIQPPKGATNPAFKIDRNVRDVTVKGFSVNLDYANGKSADDQKYLEVRYKDVRGALRFENNWFTGSSWANTGLFIIQTGGSADSLTFSGNRIQNSGVSNGMWIGNGALLQLNIQNNVWLNNLGRALNISDDTPSAPREGTISGNWIGNSTPGEADGVDRRFSRQTGIVLAGTMADPLSGQTLEIRGNTFANIEEAAIDFFTELKGAATIVENQVVGYSNAADKGAILIRPQSPLPDLSNVTMTGNSFSSPVGTARAVANASGASLDATGNWWGQATGPADGQISGTNVMVDPWCLTDTCGPAEPSEPPAADSDALTTLLAEEKIDPAQVTEESFTQGEGIDPTNVSPLVPFSGELDWEFSDLFADGFGYSTPLELGVFPIEDGKLIIENLDLSGLAPGTHTLVFRGQNSEEIFAMQITIGTIGTDFPGDDSDDPGDNSDDTDELSGGLPATGSSVPATLVAFALAITILGAGLLRSRTAKKRIT